MTREFHPTYYLTEEAAAKREQRLVEAVAKEGLRESGLNTEGFECAETVPLRIALLASAVREGCFTYTNRRAA